ncbi:phage virion morphogenesis protein [Grimontia kaedaensis]|uniref:Phage virion morphogenesis protein n=1 Tax=Grimontia kaedaensis TaxID=2872157 RepID=A0ABY4WR78_9GAMM|nr:phage virion morphogenesis protein [Grimontia kaedaensis]USH01069.1 phage virion morphogenesis protein [Grimontia kaedaensis]
MAVGAAVELRGIERLNRVLLRLTKVDTQEAMGALANLVESQTRSRLEDDKRSPDGNLWPAWSDSYAATRHGNHRLLENEGHLIDSLVSVVRDDGAEVGSNLVYASTHQYGDSRRGIPQRAFLGVNDDDLFALEAALNAWADAILEDAA